MSLETQLEALLHTPGREISGLAVAAVRGGEVAYEGYFGRRYIDPQYCEKDLPVSSHTKFRVASISKILVGLAVMQWVEQGRLELDRDLSDYFDFPVRNPHFPHIPLSLRHLLSHTSSLRDGRLGYSLPLPHTVSEFFTPGQPYFEDGSHFGTEPPGYFSYCNLNYGLMGTLLERISGQRFDVYMRQHWLEPLGLEASFNVRDFRGEALKNLAPLYRKGRSESQWEPLGPWVAQVDDYRGQAPTAYKVENPDQGNQTQAGFDLEGYTVGSNGTLFSPQGGLRISLGSLIRLMRFLLGGGELAGTRLLKPTTLEHMLTPQWRYSPAARNGDPYKGLFQAWTLGLQQFTHTPMGDALLPHRPLPWVGHLGDAYGLLGGFLFDPVAQHGVIYLIGGVGCNPTDHPGLYSAFSHWEEEILCALLPLCLE